LNRTGLARLFGELEAAVMEALWDLGDGTVATVSAELGTAQQYTTIQTVLNRLVDKGILERVGLLGGAVVYRPLESQQVFLERTSRLLVASLLRDFGQAAVRGLVDAVGDTDPEQLAALEATVRAKRRDS
jgi:predicted transcriptional regulator